jgi:hypothetical protein
MGLVEIADDMKRRAKKSPGEKILPLSPLYHGARLKLKYNAETFEFHLQVQRKGTEPEIGTPKREAWERELRIFARDFGAAEDAKTEYQQGETIYAAVITWTDESAALNAYGQWAAQVSQM